jgi:hypothetical protein
MGRAVGLIAREASKMETARFLERTFRTLKREAALSRALVAHNAA